MNCLTGPGLLDSPNDLRGIYFQRKRAECDMHFLPCRTVNYGRDLGFHFFSVVEPSDHLRADVDLFAHRFSLA